LRISARLAPSSSDARGSASAEISAAMAALRNEHEELKDRFTKLREENKLLVANLREANGTLLQETNQRLTEQELDAAKRTISSLQSECETLQKSMQTLQQSLESKLADCERALNECNAREEMLNASVQEARENLTALNLDREQTLARLHNMERGPF